MQTKQDIIDAIRRTAKENGGKPLGKNRFSDETGIKPYDWQKYWARFGDVCKEAGFEPNQITVAYTEEFLIKKMIGLMRKLSKFPTYGEMRLERNSDPEFPGSRSVFETKEEKRILAEKILEWCQNKDGFDDIVRLCEPILTKSRKEEIADKSDINVGEVYLFKSGRYYKIGKTYDTVRRGKELKIQLPEKCEWVHSIKTDDPSGIEAYWHKRFEAKRMQGEWFDLTVADVKAFKRWRHIA